MKKAIVSMVAALLMTGCTQVSVPAPAKTETIIVTDSELFTGEMQKLAPHLDIISGDAVDFNKTSDITVSFEVWQDGKRVESATGIADSEAETLSFSLRPDSRDPKKQLITMAFNDGGTSLKAQIDSMPVDIFGQGPVELTGSDGLAIKPGEKKAVWGYAAKKENAFSANSIEDVKKSSWGLLIYIKAGN